MRRTIEFLTNHPLFSSSLIMILGSNMTNFINYLYHFIMVRLLSPASYGELATLIALLGLIGLIPGSLSLVIVKYVSSAKSRNEIQKLVHWLNHKVLILGLIIFAALILSSSTISKFIKIENQYLVILIGISFIFVLPTTLNRSVLQGLLRFKHIIFSILAENLSKLLLGILLVYIGYSVGGAVLGLVLAIIIGWAITRFFIKDYYVETNGNINARPLLLFSVPVLLQALSLTSLYSTDLMLVKHFFSAHDAGLYAAISKMGQIIFFGTGPIGAVMFPLISKRQSQGKNYHEIFFYSLVLTAVLSLAVLLFYYIAPDFAINLFLGVSYLEARNLLFVMGVFMSLFAVSSLFVSFNLSIGKSKVVILPILAAIMQSIGIFLFHDGLNTVITVSILVCIVLLLGLILYSLSSYYEKKF